MAGFFRANTSRVSVSLTLRFTYSCCALSLLLGSSLLRSSESISFTPDQNDFRIQFPSIGWGLSHPRIEQEGTSRQYSVGLFPLYSVTVADISEASGLWELINKPEDTQNVEQVTTLMLFPRILGDSDAAIAQTQTSAFRGKFCVLYEFKRRTSLLGEISNFPFLFVGAVFSNIDTANNSASVYHVSLSDVVKNPEDEMIARREFENYLSTFHFVKPIDYEGLPEASVTVYSIPPGAALYVDGRSAGITPATVSLKLGVHIIELTKDGFSEFAKDVEIADDIPISVTYELPLNE